MEKTGLNKKENKLGLMVLIVSILVCLMTVSYALWSRNYEGKKENVLKTGTLILRLNQESESISLLNTVPLSDSSGLKQKAYTFSLENTGTADANYRISMIDDLDTYQNDQCSDKKLEWSFLRYAFVEGNTTPIIEDLAKNDGLLQEGTIKSGTTISFSLKLWLKGETTTTKEMGKHFHGKIKVDAIQSDQELK